MLSPRISDGSIPAAHGDTINPYGPQRITTSMVELAVGVPSNVKVVADGDFLRLGKENVAIGLRTSVLIQGANRGGIEGRGKLDGYGGPRCGRVGANVNCKSGGLAGALRRNGVYVCRGAPLVVQGNFAGVKIGAEIGLNAGNLQCRRNAIGGRNIVVGISAHAKIVDAVNAGDRTRKKCIRGAFNVISR